MNIKSVTNSIILTEKVAAKKETKTLEADKDREPSQNSGEHSQQDDGFDEEDVKKAFKYLQNHPGLNKSNLKVSLEKLNEVRLFLIKDHAGKIVRKLSLTDAIFSSRQADPETKDQKGRLLNKAI